MIRNIKALGLAAIAALAMSAMVASAAQANFTSANYDATVTAESTKDVFHAFGSTVECTKGTFTGNLPGPSGTNNLTITPTYSGCTFGGLPATVEFTNCDYVFHATPSASVDVACNGGGQVDITIFGSKAAHEAKTPLCHIFVPVQSNLTGITYTNKANGKVNISGNVGGIEATLHRTSFTCPTTGEPTNGGSTIRHTKSAEYTIQAGGIEVSGNNGAVQVHGGHAG